MPDFEVQYRSLVARMQDKTVLGGVTTTTAASISNTSSSNNMSLSFLDLEGAGVGNLSSDPYDAYYDMYDTCGLEKVHLLAESRAARLITLYLYPALVVLGSLGNLSSILILRQLSANAWSSCLYLAVLGLVELVVLYIRCGGYWLLRVAGVNPFMQMTDSSDAMCKINLFVLNVFLQMWPWLMVALSVELLISTRFPLKTYSLCTTERARATVLLVTILLVCLNLNFFWTWGLVEGGGCRYIEEFSREFLEVIWPSIEMAVKHILPLVVVTVCFFVSCVSLLRSGGARQASYEPVLKRYFLDLQALQQLKHAALVVSLLFIVVKTLTFSVELLNALEYKGVIVVPCEHQAVFQARLMLVRAVRDASVYCFHSLKFFVYFGLCQRFRRIFFASLRQMFFCCCCCCCCGGFFGGRGGGGKQSAASSSSPSASSGPPRLRGGGRAENSGGAKDIAVNNRRLEDNNHHHHLDDNDKMAQVQPDSATTLNDLNSHPAPTSALNKTTHV